MRDDGVRRALAFFTSAYSSYSGCRQYRENLAAARSAVGRGCARRSSGSVPTSTMRGSSTRSSTRPSDAVRGLDPDQRAGCPAGLHHALHPGRRWPSRAAVPARRCLRAASTVDVAAVVAAGACPSAWADRLPWDLVYQSRSGAPHVPWLEPDIDAHLRTLAADGCTAAVVVPIGFVSDHVEVLWDLDTQARATADEVGLPMVRVADPGHRPAHWSPWSPSWCASGIDERPDRRSVRGSATCRRSPDRCARRLLPEPARPRCRPSVAPTRSRRCDPRERAVADADELRRALRDARLEAAGRWLVAWRRRAHERWRPSTKSSPTDVVTEADREVEDAHPASG